MEGCCRRWIALRGRRSWTIVTLVLLKRWNLSWPSITDCSTTAVTLVVAIPRSRPLFRRFVSLVGRARLPAQSAEVGGGY
eukprot:8803145-Pyramimonas_sp.AAC.1